MRNARAPEPFPASLWARVFGYPRCFYSWAVKESAPSTAGHSTHEVGVRRSTLTSTTGPPQLSMGAAAGHCRHLLHFPCCPVAAIHCGRFLAPEGSLETLTRHADPPAHP